MSTPGFISTWPHPFHRLVDGKPGPLAEVFQLRPDLVEELRSWSGGQVVFINGGPAVLLPGAAPLTRRLVGLGDFAVRADTGFLAEPAAGFYQRYQPADLVATS